MAGRRYGWSCLGALALGLLSSAGACRSVFDWRSHVSLRAGKGLRLSYIDPAEPLEASVSANLHYVSVAVEAAYLRNIPGVDDGKEVALGLEVRGLGAGDEILKSVVDVQRARGPEGSLVFQHAFSTAPVVYRGRNVEINLFFRPLSTAAAAGVRGRIGGVADLVRRLDPRVGEALQVGRDLFHSIIRGSAGKAAPWSYSVVLHPADSTHRDKPEMLFTAARHVLLLLPPPGAPAELRRVRPEQLVGELRLSGDRLVWKGGDEYTSSPYLVISVTRYRRYPNPDSRVRRSVRRMEALLEQGAFDQAIASGRTVAEEIAADRVVSVVERNLERSWLALRYAKARAGIARAQGRRQDELRYTLRQVERLAALRADFRGVLEPAERQDVELRLSRLTARARELNRTLGGPPAQLQARLEPLVGKVAAAKEQERALRREVKSVRGQLRDFRAEMLRRQEKLAKALKERERFLPKIYKQGWFWTLVGTAVAGTATALYLALRPPEQKPEPGAVVPLQLRVPLR